MDNLSRRSFLKKSSVAVGTAGVAVAAPGLAKVGRESTATRAAKAPVAADAEHEIALPSHADAREPIVAHVRDVSTGEIDLFVGTRRVTVKDRATAARLYRATR